jgi:DNA-binding response OmpR family regulator/DNA-binding CsgD family transcriptional regulator
MAAQNTAALVLVIDDDADAREMLRAAIEGEGDRVVAAPDAASGRILAAASKPDLILMDAIMPGQSGFEACRALKSDPELAHIPVLFMTGLAETEHVVEGFAAGGVDYLTKPVVLQELLARMKAHLSNARAAQSARVALDIAGRSVLTALPNGAIIWSTPQASMMIGQVGGLSQEIADLAARALEPGARTRLTSNGRNFELVFLGRAARDELFFRIVAADTGQGVDALRAAFGLTAREADVLLWIARGKSNRDASEILNISPRTVNKHLEQIFEKLGVENRAAAAAAATRIMVDLG